MALHNVDPPQGSTAIRQYCRYYLQYLVRDVKRSTSIVYATRPTHCRSSSPRMDCKYLLYILTLHYPTYRQCTFPNGRSDPQRDLVRDGGDYRFLSLLKATINPVRRVGEGGVLMHAVPDS